MLASASPAAALGPAPHDLDRTHVDVRFYPDGTFQIDVLNPPDWLLDALEPLSPNPSATLLEGEARERRLAELTGTFAEWVWMMFDGTRIEAFPEYLPAPPGPGTDPSRPPMGTMRMRGAAPPGATRFSFAYGIANDPYPMLITAGDGTLITHWVGGPVESDAFDIAALTPPSRWSVILTYLKLGFTHILPKGLDHILFVIGIYLLSTRLQPILAQVTAFTLAHTITLGLTIFGILSLRSSIVEPLIALSIAYVAVENLFTSKLKPWRLALVFGFGLLHGMGFAGVLSELGLPRSERLTGLLSFNLGVEGGQLAIIAGMFLTVGWFRHRPWYRARVVVPISLAIAVVGLYWTVTRSARG
ncbi:MAG: HupE/UreJ family protein [Gemmatimonadetes bacterium]|nr:HupE/UreJ family protein [Gemmatimonadota bacterium]